jgi:hypothetical protein
VVEAKNEWFGFLDGRFVLNVSVEVRKENAKVQNGEKQVK